MKNKILLIVLSLSVIAAVLLSSCAVNTTTASPATTQSPSATSSKPPVTSQTPTTTTPLTSKPVSNWWDKLGEPKYGGSITVYSNRLPATFDPYFAGPAGGVYMSYEHPFFFNWTTDRSKFGFQIGYIPVPILAGRTTVCIREQSSDSFYLFRQSPMATMIKIRRRPIINGINVHGMPTETTACRPASFTHAPWRRLVLQ